VVFLRVEWFVMLVLSLRCEATSARPSYLSLINCAWCSPGVPTVVFFSHRFLVVSLPRPIRRIFLPSMVHGDLPTPHPSYFSLIDGAWRSPRAPPVVFFPHR